jgi:transposase
MRFRRWEARGVWRRLWQNLQTERFAQARALLLDSRTVRAHQHAADARFFNKLKEFRRIATRYDKLAKTFFAALHLLAAFLIIRNS